MYKYLFTILFSLFFISCKNQIGTAKPPELIGTEQILQMHKKLALDEQIGIEAFLNRKGWGNMERTGSGLYIFPRPTANSHSIPIKYGDTVVFSAKIFLLNGTKIFDGIQTVIIGKTEIIQGLREALGRVRYGENAFLVVPSHLAFGFSGDGDAVPPYATLIYELNIRNKN